MTPPLPVGSYELTLRVLARRAAGYRNLAVAVALLGLATPLAAALFGSWSALLALLLLLPLCVASFARDAALVARWRATILDEWTTGNFDLDSFAAMLAAMPALPAQTLAAMLDPLPTRRRLGEEHRPPRNVRWALALTVSAIERAQIRQCRMRAAGSAGFCALVAAGVIAYSAWVLMLLPVVWGAHRLRSREIHLGSGWARDIRRISWSGEEEILARNLLNRLDWRGVVKALETKESL